MKASEMTNEELANELDNVLVNDELQTFAEVDRQIEILHEAAARLRKADSAVKDAMATCADEKCPFDFPEIDRANAGLRRNLNVAEDALEKCSKVECEGSYDGITCKDCDLACDGRCAQWMAKKALAAIRKEGTDSGNQHE